MTIQQFIDKFNEIEDKDKSLILEFMSPYNQMKTCIIDNVIIHKVGNKYCFDIETSGNIF